MKRLYMIEADANKGGEISVEVFALRNESKKGVIYERHDGTQRRCAAGNLYRVQVMDHGTRAKCVFPCLPSEILWPFDGIRKLSTCSDRPDLPQTD